MSGSSGACATVVGFIFPGVMVRVRMEYDGRLLPWMLRAVTDNSYIVYGFRSLTIVLLYVAEIWSKNDKHITGPMMRSAVARWMIQYTGLGIYF
jgi:hypothetical protein